MLAFHCSSSLFISSSLYHVFLQGFTESQRQHVPSSIMNVLYNVPEERQEEVAGVEGEEGQQLQSSAAQ